jgi:hypothetical protein
MSNKGGFVCIFPFHLDLIVTRKIVKGIIYDLTTCYKIISILGGGKWYFIIA